ncbi:uncharacterized hydrophobic domain-containing protein [Kytococcus aerolatus]|uniref:Uncharacterized hydrophobic domain-containing protein n=1 Tax=Kytococcus aerolatus TaxID=592308 RepID=A0A212U545_9MICO|nr:DUF389 domain-containing protein [Kytococcus aerolatus]SNC73382.1 uncharacterized hydrophobic domain-containing protein [Kytococcus aerolatus]
MSTQHDTTHAPRWTASSAVALAELAALAVVLGALASVPARHKDLALGAGAGAVAVWAALMLWRALRREASLAWTVGLALGVMGSLVAGLGLATSVLPDGAWPVGVRLLGLCLVLLTVAEVRWRHRDQGVTGPGLNEMAFAALATTCLLTPGIGLHAVLFSGISLLGLHTVIDAAERAGLTDLSPEQGTENPPGRLERWLRMNGASGADREEVVGALYLEGPDARSRTAQFLVQMALATAIATLGVVTDSTAVVIGAMVVAPLMIPIMGVGLSLGMGWPRRLGNSLAVAGLGIAVALACAFLIVRALDPGLSVVANTQIASRTAPSVPDLLIAVASGAAGAFALSRRGLSTSLPGVAIAIALVPPLAVVATCLEQAAWAEAGGAALLFVTNVVCMAAASGLTFVLSGVVPVWSLDLNRRRIGSWGVGVGVSVGLVLSVLGLGGIPGV